MPNFVVELEADPIDKIVEYEAIADKTYAEFEKDIIEENVTMIAKTGPFGFGDAFSLNPDEVRL